MKKKGEKINDWTYANLTLSLNGGNLYEETGSSGVKLVDRRYWFLCLFFSLTDSRQYIFYAHE